MTLRLDQADVGPMKIGFGLGHKTRGWLTCLLIACAVASSPCAAQTSAGDKAMAEALFDRGVSLMKQGKYSEACPALEQSQAIERGVGTLLYLAECYEKLGRSASAWAMFREAASSARAEGQLDRAKTGTARADKLEPTLSKLSIQVNTARAVSGLQVFRNDQPVPMGAWGQPVPVDPGEQHVEARAPGYASWSVTLNLPANGALLTVDVPELTAVATVATTAVPPAADAASSEPLPAAPTSATAGTPSDEGARRATWQKPLGLVLGGVGVVGLGLGTYFGLRAISKKNDADDECPAKTGCTDLGKKSNDQAQSAATLANVFVIGGAACLIGGAVLYFTAPSNHATQLALRGTGSGAMLELGGAL